MTTPKKIIVLGNEDAIAKNIANMAQLKTMVEKVSNNAMRVRTLPDDSLILHTKCDPVLEITENIKAIARIQEFFLQLHALDKPTPLAISAPQLGYLLRMFSYVKGAEREIITVINPEIVYEKKIKFSREGCLSIPGRNYELKRASIMKIRGLDVDGHITVHKGHDSTAFIFRHEIDHLNGITVDMKGKAY